MVVNGEYVNPDDPAVMERLVLLREEFIAAETGFERKRLLRGLTRNYLTLFQALLPCVSADILSGLVRICLTEVSRERLKRLAGGTDELPEESGGC